MRAGDSDVHLRDRLPTSAEPAAAWRPYVETCVEAFGPSRRTFESGLPVDKGMGGYAVMWNASKRLPVGASAHDRAALFGGRAVRNHRLDRLPSCVSPDLGA
jgi:predicted TIM-barrel fold metal-dependent hydrolase